MASSSAPNIVAASMSFSRETWRITYASMFSGLARSYPSSPSPAALRPLILQPRLPNIAETDIIGFALLLINDTEDVRLDGFEPSAKIAASRPRGIASLCLVARPLLRLRHDSDVRLDANPPAHEPTSVVERIELPVEPGRRDLERIAVR